LTREESPTYLPDTLNSPVVATVQKVVLLPGEYCFIMHPSNKETLENEWGKKKLISGPIAFFPQPREVYSAVRREILSEDMCMSVYATEEAKGKKPGEEWILYGPAEFVPGEDGVEMNSQSLSFFKYEPLNLIFFHKGPFIFQCIILLMILKILLW